MIKGNICFNINLPNEIWKETKYKGYYVSNKGRIKSLPNATRTGIRIIKQFINDGYLIVSIANTTVRVNRLVAIAFHPNPNNLPEVNHKDHDRLNNNDWNLEWDTTKDNVTKALGEPVKQINKITKEVIAEYNSAAEAASILGFSTNAHILDVCNRKYKCKTAGGYIWRFKHDYKYAS